MTGADRPAKLSNAIRLVQVADQSLPDAGVAGVVKSGDGLAGDQQMPGPLPGGQLEPRPDRVLATLGGLHPDDTRHPEVGGY